MITSNTITNELINILLKQGFNKVNNNAMSYAKKLSFFDERTVREILIEIEQPLNDFLKLINKKDKENTWWSIPQQTQITIQCLNGKYVVYVTGRKVFNDKTEKKLINDDTFDSPIIYIEISQIFFWTFLGRIVKVFFVEIMPA